MVQFHSIAPAIVGLLSPTATISGKIWFRPQQGGGFRGAAIDLLQLPEAEKQKFRGSQISMISQKPMSSLNPVYTISKQPELKCAVQWSPGRDAESGGSVNDDN